MKMLLTPLNVNCHASDGRKVSQIIDSSISIYSENPLLAYSYKRTHRDKHIRFASMVLAMALITMIWILIYQSFVVVPFKHMFLFF